MNYADFDPCLIRERNEGLRREVRRLRLEKRLRANREEHGLRFLAFPRAATKPLLRVMGLAGRRRARIRPARSAVVAASVDSVYPTREGQAQCR